jgi:hypothetical protein
MSNDEPVVGSFRSRQDLVFLGGPICLFCTTEQLKDYLFNRCCPKLLLRFLYNPLLLKCVNCSWLSWTFDQPFTRFRSLSRKSRTQVGKVLASSCLFIFFVFLFFVFLFLFCLFVSSQSTPSTAVVVISTWSPIPDERILQFTSSRTVDQRFPFFIRSSLLSPFPMRLRFSSLSPYSMTLNFAEKPIAQRICYL